jgi:Double zinc ribbon
MAWLRRPRFARPAGPPPPAAPPVDGAPVVDPMVHVPPPRRMRRERHALARRREIEIRDVGGLAVEMVRRDRFRSDLLAERANDVLIIEQRLNELDALLMASLVATRGPLRTLPRCECGAPLPPGVHFCSHCGRPAPGSRPVAVCSHCGQPLPADANFCAYCGNSAAAEQFEADQAYEDTMVRPWSAGEERDGDL